ncbi:MAG: hypothetical protein K0R57_6016 [Paenibacillaceae bacterium]|jgi:uncharacterized repeat protein (TIGR01451 family)|nr:hypothetical protein [Paenibacillaceae bacterium]
MTPDTLRDGVLLNQSHIRYTTGNNSYIAYSNTVSTLVIGPVLTVIKNTDATQAQPGVPVTYTATIINTGNRAADTTLYDLLPGGTQFVANSILQDGRPLPGASLATGLWLGAIGIGEMVQLSFQLVYSAAGGSGQLANRLRAEYTFLAANGRLVTDSALSNEVVLPIVAGESPEILVIMSVDKTRAAPGETIRYSLIVVNQGGVAGDATLTAGIPAGMLYVRNSLVVNGLMRSGDFPPGGISLGLLTSQSQMLVTYEVVVPGYGSVALSQIFSNQAAVSAVYLLPGNSAAQTETSSSNAVSTQIFFPVLDVNVIALPEIVEPEDVVDYTVNVGNNGNMGADTALGRLNLNQISLIPGTIRINGIPAADPGPSGSLQLGLIAPQQTVQVTYRALVSPFLTTLNIRGSVTAYYSFWMNDNQHRGETLSNTYLILVESGEE